MTTQYKNYWHQFPLLWIAIALGCGIFCAQFLPVLYASYFFVAFIIAGFIGSFILNSTKKFLQIKQYGRLLLVFSFCLGIGVLQLKVWLDLQKLLPADNSILLQGTVKQKFSKSLRPRYLIEVDYAGNQEVLQMHKADIIVIFDKKDTASQRYIEGDQVIIYGIPESIESTTNPRSFNYNQHLSDKSIFQQITVKFGHHRIATSTILSSSILRKLRQIKNHSLTVLDKYIIDPDAKGIAMALILGHVDLISDDTYKGFADAGAIHVLSVSGLHVMVFIGVFLWISDKIKTNSLWSKILKVLLLILLTLFYVVLTGMAPSIVRSGVMVSLYLVGKYVLKRQNSYNILAFAAIVMLFYNPKYLFQISFQFSFLALLSILYFYPVFKSWYSPKHWLDKYIWELGIVGVAAQILVLPFSLFYFHKFPLYFILSGIIAVPLSGLIIYGGFLLIIFDFLIGSFVYPLGFALNYVLQWLNWFIIKISQLPFAVIDGLYVDYMVLLLLTFIVISLIIYISFWYKNALYVLILACLFCISWVQWSRIDAFLKDEIQVYDTHRGILVDLFTHGKLFTYSSASLGAKSISFAADNNRAAHFASKPHKLDSELLTFGDKHIWLIDSVSSRKILPKVGSFDMMIVNANIPPPAKDFNISLLIIGPMVKPYNFIKWEAYIARHKILKTHFLASDGAICVPF